MSHRGSAQASLPRSTLRIGSRQDPGAASQIGSGPIDTVYTGEDLGAASGISSGMQPLVGTLKRQNTMPILHSHTFPQGRFTAYIDGQIISRVEQYPRSRHPVSQDLRSQPVVATLIVKRLIRSTGLIVVRQEWDEILHHSDSF